MNVCIRFRCRCLQGPGALDSCHGLLIWLQCVAILVRLTSSYLNRFSLRLATSSSHNRPAEHCRTIGAAATPVIFWREHGQLHPAH